MTCMCGDTYCLSCGPAQGNEKCPECGTWSFDGGCSCIPKEEEMSGLKKLIAKVLNEATEPTPQDELMGRYVDGQTQCPFCGDDGCPQVVEYVMDSPRVYVDMHCPECGAEWADHYTLTSISQSGDPIGKPERTPEQDELYSIQKKLGCPGCFYADTNAIGKEPCCTKLTSAWFADDGSCGARKDKS